ncbi:SDR family NAD(P)-dependent oxidoreductase [Lapidilactobacillus bayanensis]|uniref:SDR family NAD(P)-dependent oxidoreductase n=1 Tax=Lapidilactobacillus bayanensis TaxID=2485998 RepID=UPI000F79F323|nr:SDR family NAD(P)-dependent oxidoreductase [Lapidilactobacillus bayanensis]
MVNDYRTLRGKVVVITGASSGIGRDIALEAASRGARVFLLARRLELLEEVRTECANLSLAQATAIQVDVSQMAELEHAVAQIQAETNRVDVLVNAAGFGDFETFAEIPVKRIEQMFRVNVFGMMLLTRMLAPMLFATKGHIVNIGSMAGKIQTPKSAVYAATKAAVIAFSNSLRLELKPLGVKVTTVNPGPVNTEFFNVADSGAQYLQKMAWLSLDPEKLAIRIVASFGQSVREINAPWFMEVAARLYPLAPKLGDFLASTIGNQK